ncbi:hypothetical protein ACFLWZ_07435 [Chloroflexota bacterium]
MKMGFGKFMDSTVEYVVLKEPKYIDWMLKKKSKPGSDLEQAKIEVERLIVKFDQKPFLKKCMGEGCNKAATRCTAAIGAVSSYWVPPFWWCEKSDPYQSGTPSRSLRVLKTYKKVLSYIETYCGGSKGDYQSAIKDMTQAKVRSKRVQAA